MKFPFFVSGHELGGFMNEKACPSHKGTGSTCLLGNADVEQRMIIEGKEQWWWRTPFCWDMSHGHLPWLTPEQTADLHLKSVGAVVEWEEFTERQVICAMVT